MDDDRIARFQALTEADPTNELGFFSLGRAFVDAGQPEKAVPALQRVIALNAGFSKAYALLGQAQKATGDVPGAIATLTAGYKVANDRGDLMVLATHNTDFGDAFEREGENRAYFDTFAGVGYAFGINALLYAMTH